MPDSDGKGPAGAGPKTGKGLGPCADGTSATPAPTKGNGPGKGNGHGNGHGKGRGNGKGPGNKQGA